MVAPTPPWPASDVARALGNVLYAYPIVIALIVIPLLFPDGRLPSRRFRWVAGFAVLALVALTFGAALGSTTAAVTDPVVFVSTIVGFAGGALAVATRFRRSDPLQRQQVKWLLADAALAAIVFPIALAMPDPETAPIPLLAIVMWLLAILTLLGLPVVIGIAVLRYRLYEIDRIVSRTIAYAIVTGLLALVFGVVVIVLSAVLSSFARAQTVAVAASTLAVFAIFQPVLRRVRRTVDRRFNRSHYDAERTTAAFSTRLRDEVDISTVQGALVSTVAEAVDPVRASVWLRPVAERP